MQSIIEKAYEIATKSLRDCYRENGIVAGNHHFTEYWGHDGFYASYGSVILGDVDQAKKHFNTFLEKQDKNTGQIPIRIGYKSETIYLILKFLGITLNSGNYPAYKADRFLSINSFPVVDNGSVLIIAIADYIEKHKDYEYASKILDRLKNIIEFNQSVSSDYLVVQNYYATWNDAIKKRGKSLYPSVCSYKATLEFAKLCEKVNLSDDYKKYNELAQKIKDAINKEFWNGSYYNDWIDEEKIYNSFSTDGNILAILYEVADKDKASKIFKYIIDNNIAPNKLIKTVHPAYPKSFVYTPLRLIGIRDYQNPSIYWLWLSCLYAIAKCKYDKAESTKILNKIAEIIVDHNNVYEIYENTEKPVNRFFYKAEVPFAWNSGLFIYAKKYIEQN